MGGQLGVDAIKKEIDLFKFSAISLFQAISKDGFQISDLAAPLGSSQVQSAILNQPETFIKAVQETKELDLADDAAIAFYVTAALKDVGTEFMLALKKIQSKI